MPLLLVKNCDLQLLQHNAGGLSANDINDKNIKDLKIKFGINNILIENH